jgi:hypothetical protein
VLDAVLALDQVALVLRVVDGGLDVLAGERLDGLDGVPEREGEELGAPALVAAQQPGAPVAGRRLVGREPVSSMYLP